MQAGFGAVDLEFFGGGWGWGWGLDGGDAGEQEVLGFGVADFGEDWWWILLHNYEFYLLLCWGLER